MILKWMRKFGILKTTLATTAVAIFSSFSLYAVGSYIIAEVGMQGILMSLIIPAIITPILGYIFAYAVIKLHSSEMALKQREEKYRTILENIEDGYFEVDIAGNFTFFNDSMCRLIGYSPSAMTGMNNREYLDEENAKKVFQTFNRVYETGEPAKGFDWEIIKVDGTRRQVDASVSLITDEDGNRIGFRGIARDITERKLSEKALSESEEKYRQLVNHAPIGICRVDFNTGKLISVNDVMCEYTGCTKEELFNMNALDFLTEESQKHFLDRLDRLFNGRQIPRTVEYRAKAKDGHEFWILLDARYEYDKNGKPKGATIVAHDITDRKQAEEEKLRLEDQLQQAQKMEAIGTLAGGIAHDFNNILSVIIGYAELVLMNGNVDGEVRQNLKEIFNASKHARDMVKQILAFSRQNKHERKPIQVRHIVKEALKLLRASLPATINIQQKIEKNTGVIKADPTQFHQVLMNLCTNAAHAMHEKDGVLKISLRNVELDQNDTARHPELKPGPYLKLSISDTGDGIHPETQDRIFDPYFTTKEKGEGTGLGLAVVQGIIKSHNGAITVESKVGQGSTFHVYLPRIQQDATTDEIDSAPLPMGHESILLVDDEQPLVDIGKQMLERLGYTVAARTSSVEALALFNAQPNRFDLVITDIVMPNMTGEKLAEKLMDIRADIPVILCTGYSEKFTRGQASNMGIRSFLMKPLVMQDLANTVRQALAAN
ncbi:MAG: PAS domain S-box protein [Desulfobacterales bacterium]|jgi:PAS domain S-box-containing protein